MDKKRAIKLLKQALDELPHLRTLDLDNKEFDLWDNKVSDILEETFGKNSTEWERFARAVSVYFPTYTNKERNREYNRRLDEYETSLKSIIQKYEIFGTEEQPLAKTEPPKTPQDEEEKAETRERELVLEGTPDMILECIKSTIERLNSQGSYIYSSRKTSGAPDYAKWDKTYFASCAISQGDEGQIGTIKLQLLPKEKTSFKYLEPKNWASSFGYFLDSLFAEFQKLEFVDLEKNPTIEAEQQQNTKKYKLWRWIKANKLWSIIIVGIPVLAALVYVVDYFWKLFSK